MKGVTGSLSLPAFLCTVSRQPKWVSSVACRVVSHVAVVVVIVVVATPVCIDLLEYTWLALRVRVYIYSVHFVYICTVHNTPIHASTLNGCIP